jgi:hypothetical protein
VYRGTETSRSYVACSLMGPCRFVFNSENRKEYTIREDNSAIISARRHACRSVGISVKVTMRGMPCLMVCLTNCSQGRLFMLKIEGANRTSGSEGIISVRKFWETQGLLEDAKNNLTPDILHHGIIQKYSNTVNVKTRQRTEIITKLYILIRFSE